MPSAAGGITSESWRPGLPGATAARHGKHLAMAGAGRWEVARHERPRSRPCRRSRLECGCFRPDRGGTYALRGSAALREELILPRGGTAPGRIWGPVAVQAARRAGRVSAADACTAAVAAVDVTGGWLTAAADGEAGHLMRITDEVSEQLAELHLTLGEGPALDASASGGPVLASDLGTVEAGRHWPAFAPQQEAALRTGDPVMLPWISCTLTRIEEILADLAPRPPTARSVTSSPRARARADRESSRP